MRRLLPFALLILALCVGCPKTAPKSDTGNAPPPSTTYEDFNKPVPLVEPLVPRLDGETSTEEAAEEAAEETMTSIVAESLGKYAAEVIPMPPVGDLTAQADEYITKLGTNLDNLDGSPRYASDATDIVRDASALSLVILAIGLAEADSKYKKAAPQMIVATQNLVAAKSYAEGQKAYDELKSALTSTGGGGGTPLSWSVKIANLTPLMKAVPNLSSAVKRLTNTERNLNMRLERNPQQIYGALAALAAISQGSIANAAETSKPDAVAEWKKYCEEFRDAALKVGTVARQYADEKADYAAFRTAINALSVSCDDCHKVFYPSAVGQE